MTNDQTVTQAAFARAASETERLQRELDITNADHVALWIEANLIATEPMSQCVSWFACRIVEAYESAVAMRRKSFGYLPGNYSIICMDCRKQVDGCAKFSIRCASCADNQHTAHSGEGRSNGAGEDAVSVHRITRAAAELYMLDIPTLEHFGLISEAALSAPQGEVEREGPLYILDRLHRGDMPTMVAMTTVQGGRLIFTNRADVDAFVEAYRRGDNAASFTVHQVARVDVRVFWQSCRDHDWHYANSDDMRVYREGGAVASQLAVQQTISREHRRIYQHWKKHHETGPAYGTERHPAPEEPALAQPEAGGEHG